MFGTFDIGLISDYRAINCNLWIIWNPASCQSSSFLLYLRILTVWTNLQEDPEDAPSILRLSKYSTCILSVFFRMLSCTLNHNKLCHEHGYKLESIKDQRYHNFVSYAITTENYSLALRSVLIKSHVEIHFISWIFILSSHM